MQLKRRQYPYAPASLQRIASRDFSRQLWLKERLICDCGGKIQRLHRICNARPVDKPISLIN
jgi:hypothetical protein